MSAIRFAAALLSLTSAIALAQRLSPAEVGMMRTIDRSIPEAEALIEKLVNINSGTFSPAGVKAVAVVLEQELGTLGFEVKLIPCDVRNRGPHLYAEHKGSHPAKPLLLIGHMDTVFEPGNQFQRFERTSATSATGPGVADMKGGVVVMLFALNALQKNGLLADANIRVFLTGDEEAPGKPFADARRDLVEAAKATVAVFCFERGYHSDGKDYVSTARRGVLTWELHVKGHAGHSSRIFSGRRRWSRCHLRD